MLIMQEQEIVTLLCLVGDELQALGVKHPIRLLLIGGAYMLTQIHNRPATRDVDVVVQKLDPQSEEYRLFKQAIAFVAHDMGASPAWLSDTMAEFLQSIGKIPRGKRWLSQGKLEVSVPNARYILALKLLAGREKDVNDIKALLETLGIANRKQAEALLKTYVEKNTRQNAAQELQATLDQFFEEPRED
jgi:hypothetical protein